MNNKDLENTNNNNTENKSASKLHKINNIHIHTNYIVNVNDNFLRYKNAKCDCNKMNSKLNKQYNNNNLFNKQTNNNQAKYQRNSKSRTNHLQELNLIMYDKYGEIIWNFDDNNKQQNNVQTNNQILSNMNCDCENNVNSLQNQHNINNYINNPDHFNIYPHLPNLNENTLNLPNQLSNNINYNEFGEIVPTDSYYLNNGNSNHYTNVVNDHHKEEIENVQNIFQTSDNIFSTQNGLFDNFVENSDDKIIYNEFGEVISNPNSKPIYIILNTNDDTESITQHPEVLHDEELYTDIDYNHHPTDSVTNHNPNKGKITIIYVII